MLTSKISTLSFKDEFTENSSSTLRIGFAIIYTSNFHKQNAFIRRKSLLQTLNFSEIFNIF